MRLVFEKFETPLELRTDALNVLRIQDQSLYARCALSLSQGFPPDCLEPASFFTKEDKEVKPSNVLFFVGDILQIDLNDRRIVAQAIKVLVGRFAAEGDLIHHLLHMNEQMEDMLEGQFLQMTGDYCLADDWEVSKYLKMLGFRIDDTEDATVYQKLVHFIKLVADLYPDWVIAFVNLPSYLAAQQYNEFCNLVIALQLRVLSYEQSDIRRRSNLENVLYIDSDYLEG